jgi:metallo-beta-lactamase class B
MNTRRSRALVEIIRCLLAAALLAGRMAAQEPSSGYSAAECPMCTVWNRAQGPVPVFGNTYWVGPEGLGSILIASESGHVLIDGALPESAPIVERNIQALGFRLEDVRIILNSHAHYDHAGGIAQLQRRSGAVVLASVWSAAVLRAGAPQRGDPQLDTALAFPAVADVRIVEDGDTVRVGPLAVVARHTPGHTPGGTTWTWRSCDGSRCLDLVYADSQTPVSDRSFRFTNSSAYPSALSDFRQSFALLETLPCDILLTPHPGASEVWSRLARGGQTSGRPLVDPEACRRYAGAARTQLDNRIKAERGP